MSHSYVSNLMHCTFSTKDRYPFIDSDLESRLWPYIGGIARENRMKALSIRSIDDHLHALLSLQGMMSFAKAVQLIKGGSSKWVHDTLPKHEKFSWQEGYGAFSVSASQAPRQSHISTIKKSTTERSRSRRNFWSSLRSTASRSGSRKHSFVGRATRSLLLTSIPALKRWARVFPTRRVGKRFMNSLARARKP